MLSVQKWGLRAKGSGFKIQGSGFKVLGFGFRVRGSGFSGLGQNVVWKNRQTKSGTESGHGPGRIWPNLIWPSLIGRIWPIFGGGGPRTVGPRRVANLGRWARRWVGPKGGGPKISRFFISLPQEISFFFLSLGVFSWNFGGV